MKSSALILPSNVCMYASNFLLLSIRRNEAAIEVCMRDVTCTDFRRPYTVLESTTAESKTPLFSYFVHGNFFPGIEILTLHRPEFSSPILAK